MSEKLKLGKLSTLGGAVLFVLLLTGMLIFVYMVLVSESISYTVDYSCKWYGENHTQCFCGSIYPDKTFEYMHFGKVIDGYCCVNDRCEKIE